jgi:Tfp pilus assembly protein FimV
MLVEMSREQGRKSMTHTAVVIAALLSVGMLAAPAATTSAASSRSHSHRQPAVTTAQPPARIACTPAGCQPIPSGCMPVPGRTWSGLPTGYDVVVCPSGASR